MRIALFLALALASCGDPDTTACVARCQSFTAEPAVCQTMCTRSCDELRRSFGIAEETCRQMQQSRADPRVPAPTPEPAPAPTPEPALAPAPADQRRATSDSTH